MTYPDELDSDDIDELASYIERRYPTRELRIHDTETILSPIGTCLIGASARSSSITFSKRAIECFMQALRPFPAVAHDVRESNVATTQIGTNERATDSRSPVVIVRMNTRQMRPGLL